MTMAEVVVEDGPIQGHPVRLLAGILCSCNMTDKDGNRLLSRLPIDTKMLPLAMLDE